MEKNNDEKTVCYEATVFIQGVTSFNLEAHNKDDAKKQILEAFENAKNQEEDKHGIAPAFDLTIKGKDLFGDIKIMSVKEVNLGG